MVEAILERRPSLEGIKTVQSKTTSEVRGKYVKFDEKKFLQGKGSFGEVYQILVEKAMSSVILLFKIFLQGIGSLGEVQHISVEFAAFGKSSGEQESCTKSVNPQFELLKLFKRASGEGSTCSWKIWRKYGQAPASVETP